MEFLPKAYWLSGKQIDIKIIKATFGYKDTRFDVTPKLAEFVATKKNYSGLVYFDKSFAQSLEVPYQPFMYSIRSSPQSKRDLNVTYEIGGKQKTKATLEVKRGGPLVFD